MDEHRRATCDGRPAGPSGDRRSPEHGRNQRRGRPHPRRARAPRRPERRRAARKPAMPTAKAPQWQFQIKTVAFDKTAIALRDETERPELRATIAPLNIDLKDVTSNFAKPFGVAIGATVNR